MRLKDSQDNHLAARIYEEVAKIRDWSLAPSPGWRIDPRKAKGMDSIRSGLDEVIKSVRQTSGRVWEAPSAWHAALYLSMLQHQMLTKGSRVLFRGHRCEDWDLSPSILRPGVDQEREERRGKAFGRLLASLSFNTGRIMSRDLDLYLRISPNSYLAAAQHYGIKTHLLDFTTDPDVAV